MLRAMSLPLPKVQPHTDVDGRTYLREYTWQETHCKRKGMPWIVNVPWCDAPQGCGCSDYIRAGHRMDDFCDNHRHDVQVSAAEALRVIRPYLPHIRTARQLFVAAAWQPFKTIFERGRVGYTNYGVRLWAKAKAAGLPAPWETEERDRKRFAQRRAQRSAA